MARHHDGRSAGRAHFSVGHIIGLLVFYSILAFCVLAFTFFYVYTQGELRFVIILTIAFGVVATAVHTKAGRRSRIDRLIDRGP